MKKYPSCLGRRSANWRSLAAQRFAGFLLLFGISLAVASPALAQTGYYTTLQQELQDKGLPQGSFIFGADEQTVLDKFFLDGQGKVDGDQATQVNVTDKEFTKAIELVNSTGKDFDWKLNWKAYTDKDIVKDDALLLVINIRTLFVESETGQGIGKAVGKPNLDGGGDFSASSGWRRIYFSFRAKEDIPAGATSTAAIDDRARIEFFIGRRKQTLQIGGLACINYGNIPEAQLTALSDLSLNYEGRETNAAWRTAADQRIDQLRKSNLKVVVKDRDGNPISGATVQVKMKRHAFPFGTAVDAKLINSNDTYKQKLAENFNAISFGNDLKWKPYIGEWGTDWGKDQALRALPWIKANKLLQRGHVLVYGDGNAPDVSNLNATELYNAIKAHIEDKAATWRGEIYEWDVINEGLVVRNLLDGVQSYKPGLSSYVDWFKIARDVDPKVKLVYNDYGVLYSGAQQDSVDKVINYLTDNGASIDGVGEQGHYSTGSLPSIPYILERLDKFKETHNLPLSITEYDCGNTEIWQPARASTAAERNAQADFTRDFYTATFSHPNTTGIQMWGFWSEAHWRPSSAMYDKDWNITPLGQAYQDLVLKKWWTNASATTDASGEYLVRGFKGDYEVEITKGQLQETISLSLLKDTTLSVTLNSDVLTVTDPLNDWSKSYAHTNFWFSKANPGPAIYGGDSSLIARNGPETESVTYNYSNINRFAATFYYNSYYTGDIKLLASADNVTFTEISTTNTAISTGGGWERRVFTANDLPTGTDFVKVEISGGTEGWTPMLAEVKLSHTADGVEVASDPLNDWSKSYAHTNFWFSKANPGPAIYEGDSSLIARNGIGTETVTYNYSNISQFVATLYYNSYYTGNVKLLASPDNVTFTEIATTNTAKPTEGGWERRVYTASGVPTRTNFVKVELWGGTQGWTPMVSSTSLLYRPSYATVTGLRNAEAGISSGKSAGLYPNPAREHFTVAYPGERLPASVRVVISNQLGAVVYDREGRVDPSTQSLRVPTRGLGSGVYQVQVISGSDCKVHRLVISN